MAHFCCTLVALTGFNFTRPIKSPTIRKMRGSERVGRPRELFVSFQSQQCASWLTPVISRCCWWPGGCVALGFQDTGLPLRNLPMAICFTPTLIGALTWCHLLLRHAHTHIEQPTQWVSCGDTPTTPLLRGRNGRTLRHPVRPEPRQPSRSAALRKGGLASLKRQRENTAPHRPPLHYFRTSASHSLAPDSSLSWMNQAIDKYISPAVPPMEWEYYIKKKITCNTVHYRKKKR